MKRPASWQARRIATQKALRALPKCATEGCEGRQIGLAWGVAVGNLTSDLCVKCAQRALREKRT